MVIEWKRDREAVEKCMGDINEQLGFWVKGGKVLDLGGGKGWALQRIEAGTKVIIDLDLDQLALSDYETVHGNVLELPFADGTFDNIIARGVLHHVPDDLERALDEARRVLVDGGLLFVQDPGGLNPLAYVARNLFPTDIHVPGERPFDPRYLRAEIGKRFAIVDERYHHLVGYLLPHIIPRLGPLGPVVRRNAGQIRRKEDALLRRSDFLQTYAGYVQFVGVKNPLVPDAPAEAAGGT